jgi:hypothetical protein
MIRPFHRFLAIPCDWHGCLWTLLMLWTSTHGPVTAHEGDHDHPAKPVAPAEAHRPTPIPDRVILSIGDDPTTSCGITWRTSSDVAHGFVEWAEATHGPEFRLKPNRIEATTSALVTDLNPAHFHSAKLTQLKPATPYVYRVGDGVNWSEWHPFETAPLKPEAFQFLYFGDAQNDVLSLWSRVIRDAARQAPKARFMIHAGDLINRPESDADWGEWFRAGSFLHASIPSVPVPGNHEQAKNEDGSRRLSHHWRAQFTLPENGPAGLEETAYTFTYGSLRVIGLNSNEKIDEQTKWLESVLQQHPAGWIVCTFHHPIFSTAKERDNKALRDAWKPLFDRYSVDLVLQGHDHTYGRTGLIHETIPETLSNVPVGVRHADPQSGTVYVVSVSGPKMYNLAPDSIMERSAEDTQLYQIIEIAGDQLRFESRTAIGSLYDGFTLTKLSDGRKRFEPRTDVIPERKREKPETRLPELKVKEEPALPGK